MISTFDEKREREEQRGDEWQFGAIQTDLAAVPIEERANYLPVGTVQRNDEMDTAGCVSRSALNILETKLDYFYDHGMHPAIKKWLDDNGYRVDGKFALCDAFIEILSGTTKNGNSIKAPVNAISNFGVIPAYLLPLKDGMTWEEYMSPYRITQAHNDLGQQFLRRLTINYEQVMNDGFAEATKEDSLLVVLSAWGIPVNNVYPAIDTPFNHAVDRFNNEIDIFDSYSPFVKRLDPSYRFFDWGYSISITQQNPYPDEETALFEVLQRFGLLRFFAAAWAKLVSWKPN